jgi:hypothetical protein
LVVALDPKHLPEDPKILQQMVLDLMAQLDREHTERNKIESLLRELLDAKRNRKSEQLSADQLAPFAAVWEARQAGTKLRHASTFILTQCRILHRAPSPACKPGL